MAVVLTMVLSGGSAGFILQRAEGRCPELYRWALAIAGTLSLGTGELWIGRLL